MQKSARIILLAIMLVFPGSISGVLLQGAVAEGLRVDKRVDSRQDRRGDRRENAVDGVEDRQVGEGPEARGENRQDLREDRRERTGDRMQDRSDRAEKRFE
jgi:hypothetical protein